jgi:kinetochore-associated protein 1
LSILVEILSTKSKLLHLTYLKSAWECVIREPFVGATKTQSYEQELKLAKSLILLQKCPISTYLNLIEFVEHCLRLDRPHMAAFFVAFVKDEQRTKIINVRN